MSSFNALDTLEQLSDACFAVDEEWRFTFVNAAASCHWGRSTESLIGTVMWDELPSLLGSPFERVYRTAALNREPAVFGSYSDSTNRWYHLHIFPAPDGLIAFYSDATEPKRKEEALATARRSHELAMQEEARRKDEFIATLAHELRNPLAPIRNALEVARLAKGNDVALEYAHGVMERQMSHMVRLIDDLLDLSRLNLGKVELKRTVVDVSSVLESAIETARPHIVQAGHTLEVNLWPDTLCVDADTTRLMQVFANLLTNAAKFTGENGRLIVSVERENDWAAIRFKDNGIGMTSAMLGQVFDMFTQEADTLNRTEGGLGIGLTLVRGLVQLHGGTVEALSDGKGEGSEFIVRLPLSIKSHSAEHRGPKSAGTAPASWHRILVVDDNVDSATTLSMMLNFMGHDTRTANDGVWALEVAESFRPDVCLLDIGMPNLNGFDLARRLRARPWGAELLLIALSGWGQEHDQKRSFEAGFDLHFVKPVDPGALGAVLSAPRRQTTVSEGV